VKFISSSSALFEKTDDENRALAVYPPFFPQLSGFSFMPGNPLHFLIFCTMLMPLASEEGLFCVPDFFERKEQGIYG